MRATVALAGVLVACSPTPVADSGFSLASAETRSASRQIALCSDEPGINDVINKLAFEALDEALRKQIENLFTTWMKDDTGQPERAATGVRRSALAYVHAREAILNWNIPPCK